MATTAVINGLIGKSVVAGVTALVTGAIAPVAIGIGFAVAGTMAFNWAYKNIDWVKGTTDWAADKIDEAVDWAGSKLNEGMEAVTNGLDLMLGTFGNYLGG